MNSAKKKQDDVNRGEPGMSAGFAKPFHDTCEYPGTCPCQHKLDAHVLREETNE